MTIRINRAVAAIIGVLLASSANATNGYFAHGYGTKAKGMAGVGIALPQDSLAAATNPAGISFVENRLDVGLELFSPRRSASISGNMYGLNGDYNGDGKKNFVVPEFGYNRRLNNEMTFGLAVYGNGGMNTEYQKSPFASFGGSSPAGVNLEQLFLAPTLAYKISPQHSLGLSLVLAYQRFSATGLGPFSFYSSDANNFTDKGTDSATGYGVRLGYTGQLSDALSIGLTYASKTNMGKFDKYKGLFAEGGSFDVPENYGIGVAFKATPQLTIAADVQEIKYSGLSAVGNSVSKLFSGNLFGSSNGPGFGWQDMTVYKIGASYQATEALTLRLGYSTTNQPIPAKETLLNILAPGVMKDHYTLGATWAMDKDKEISAYYMLATKQTVNGSSSIPANFGGGEANLRMKQNSLGVAFGWKM